jgi:molecular chaperone DnaK (HSP70)
MIKVVLIGGSARVRRLREVVADAIGRTPFAFDLNPEELAARGAARLGHMISSTDEEFCTLTISDPLEMSLGLQGANGTTLRMLRRNLLLPVQNQSVCVVCQILSYSLSAPSVPSDPGANWPRYHFWQVCAP